MNQHTHEVLDEVAKKAARAAIDELLLALGIDVTDPIKMQKDFEFLRSVRELGEAARRKTVTTAVGVIVTAVLGIIGYALAGHLK